MSNSLEERLQQHSNAFDGLLSLIPAKYYYDEDTSNQWQQKRKSKEEHQNNKRQKLAPTNNKNVTAKDVLKETEKTAKPVMLPGEKMRALLQKQAEADENGEVDSDDDDDDDDVDEDDDDESEGNVSENAEKVVDEEVLLQENVTIVFDDNGEEIEQGVEFKKAEAQKQQKNQKGKKVLTPEEIEERERKHKELKAKLEAKLQNMREKRKAPGTKVPGAATSRQQILEERRKRLETKKNSKKTVESDSSDDEDDDDDDELVDEAAKEYANAGANVMFGNIEFADGDRVSSDLTSTRKVDKKKGPANKDIKGHLKKLEREKLRKEDMDQEARNKLEDKQKWQKALASVQGLKVKDDEKLLKKALRRKESKKRKSEREWNERIETVATEKKMKADRREENLKIRRENKGKDRKSQTKQLPSYKRSRAHKKLPGAKRAGFEGGIRSGKGGKGGPGGKGDNGGKGDRGGKGGRGGRK